MKTYGIDVVLHGTCRQEDPRCPSAWRGSGCYDIDVDVLQKVSLTISADSEDTAKSIAMDYDYRNDMDDICSVEIEDSGWVGEDDSSNEVIEISYGDVKSAAECFEPDWDLIRKEKYL